MRRERLPLTVATAFALPTVILGLAPGQSVGALAASFLGWLPQPCIALGFGCGFAMVWMRVRSAEARALPARDAYAANWRRLRIALPAERLASLAVLSVALAATMAGYGAWKIWLNEHVPFSWDARLASWGAALHGAPPWTFFRWAIASPVLLRSWELVYNVGWTVVIPGVVVWRIVSPPSAERTRFLTAFVAAWPVAGIVLAGFLMSAGPVYYDRVAGGMVDPYAPLRVSLDHVSWTARYVQEFLWSAYVHHRRIPGAGISAMPSMHLVTAMLTALTIRRASGWLFLVLIFAGSVLTGWHYSLDGYVGIVAALALWTCAGRLVRSGGRQQAAGAAQCVA